MLLIIWIALAVLSSAFLSYRDLVLEVLTLRQQLAAVKSRGKEVSCGSRAACGRWRAGNDQRAREPRRPAARHASRSAS